MLDEHNIAIVNMSKLETLTGNFFMTTRSTVT